MTFLLNLIFTTVTQHVAYLTSNENYHILSNTLS